MESLQLAQMLADISALNTTDTKAAVALVNANKTLEQQQQQIKNDSNLKPPEQRHHSRVASATATQSISRTNSPAKRFDKFGRTIMTPPLTRSNSAQGSMPGTPRLSDHEDDVDRASTLMALYEIRAKLKQQDNSSLIKAREKINAMIANQKAQLEAEAKEGQAPADHPRSSRYTYPKST